MAGSAIDHVGIGNVFTIVYAMSVYQEQRLTEIEQVTNEDCPYIDEDEERHVGEFLEWKDEWEDVIRYALCKTIDWVECVTRVRRGHDPFVMRLVQRLVYFRMVQTSMNPVNTEIREDYEQRELHVVVESERSIRGRVIKLPKAADLGKEARSCEDGHQGHGDHGLADLEFDLILEVLWVGEGGVVEDETVRKGSTDEVQY